MKVKKLKVSNSVKEYQPHEKPKRRNWRARCPLARAHGVQKGDPFAFFNIHSVAKYQKIEGGRDPLRNFFLKEISQYQKN